MTNELAASLITIARQYADTRRRLPDHLVADLVDVARADSISHVLRNQAQRLLRSEAA